MFACLSCLIFLLYSEPQNNTEENSSTAQPKDSQEVKVEKDNQGESESNTQVSKNTDNTSELGASDGKASQKSQSVPQSVDRTEDSTLDNERVTVDQSDSENMIDNQNVVSSPEVSKPPEVKTSTPQTEDGRVRERHDSRLSIEEEEAEFEEDKIMGKLGDDKCHSLFSFFLYFVCLFYLFLCIFTCKIS